MAERTLIFNAHLYGQQYEWQTGWLLIEGKLIRAIGPGGKPEYLATDCSREIDADGRALLPGFIDLHVHGAVGHDVMDASLSGLQEMAQFYAQHGVTAFLATAWSAPREDILAALQAVGEAAARRSYGARLLGAYLEGPYLNPAKCGAQDTRFIRQAEREEALAFLDTGLVRLLALAPEFPENLWLIDECIQRGIVVSAAHTEASYEQMCTAVEHGLSHVTHCFNAMAGFNHRQLGTVGAAMAILGITCELIADNIHVHPVAQKILVDVKGPSGVILVTDAIRGTGLPDSEYPLGNRVIKVHDGSARLADGTLAGSVLTMEKALQNVITASRRPLQEVWRMTSLNPARAIGISTSKGSIQVGFDADLVLLDEDFQVYMTIVEGEIVYERD